MNDRNIEKINKLHGGIHIFWRKKKPLIEEAAVSALYLQAVTFSYDIHDMAMESDSQGYLNDKGEELYYHIVAASAMTALFELDEKHYSLYYDAVMSKLSEKFTRVPLLAQHYNDWVKEQYKQETTESDNLFYVISYWLYGDVGSEVESQFNNEIIVYENVANIIINVYRGWFTKNEML